MKKRKCPYRGELCHDYGDCESCEWSGLITKYERKIERLKKKAEQTRKKTAREILNRIANHLPAFQYETLSEAQRNLVTNEDWLNAYLLKELAREYGVEAEE